jgi:hypothetical protein
MLDHGPGPVTPASLLVRCRAAHPAAARDGNTARRQHPVLRRFIRLLHDARREERSPGCSWVPISGMQNAYSLVRLRTTRL